MAIYTEELNTNFNFPNINIYNRYRDGVHTAYRVYPAEGYVMYDINDEFYIQDSPDSEPVLTRRYWTMAGLTLNYDFTSFPYVAVLRSEVDENYIFGGGENNNHEVM